MILRRRPSVSRVKSGSQYEPQITLITFQPAPRKRPSSSWMILPLPRTGPSRRCRLQLTTKVRLSSPSRPASESAEVAVEARLVDGGQRPEAHGHRGELPEVGHQPRVRVRAEALAGHHFRA